jgi:hypothetical protein
MSKTITSTTLLSENDWLVELPQLMWKHSAYGFASDLAGMTLKDLRGLYSFLQKVDANARKGS